MLSNMVTSLFAKERITTTDPKAKEARREAERLITRAKKGYAAYKEHQTHKEAGREAESKQMQAVALAHWREAGRVVRDRTVLKKLFDELAPLYMERPGGYTRIIKVGNRLGDNARTVLLELVESKVTREPMTKKAKKKGEKEEGPEEEKGKKKEKPAKTKGKRAEKGLEKKGKGAAKPLTTKRTAKEKRPEGA
jgi:large subunit ribosomal protein L17